MRLRTLFLATLLATFLPTGLAARAAGAPDQAGPCPGDHPILRQFVERILTTDAKAADRDALGLADVAGQPLRLLGETRQDYPVCTRLYRQVPREYSVRTSSPSAPSPRDPARRGPGRTSSCRSDLELNEIGVVI